jgi:hypothetical protein
MSRKTRTASSAPHLSGQALLALRGLHERQRAAREQLGALDLDRAKLDAMAAPIRQRLVDIMVETDAATLAAGKDAGIDLSAPGWRIDLATGALLKS